MNVGPATLGDLLTIGVTSVAALREQDPQCMFQQLERITSTKQNVCVLDVFCAVVHEARTGEGKHWSKFSKLRLACT